MAESGEWKAEIGEWKVESGEWEEGGVENWTDWIGREHGEHERRGLFGNDSFFY